MADRTDDPRIDERLPMDHERDASIGRSALPFSPLRLQAKLRKLLGPEALGG